MAPLEWIASQPHSGTSRCRKAGAIHTINGAQRRIAGPIGGAAASEFGQDTPSSVCDGMIAHIVFPYAIEREVHGHDPSTRRAVRQKSPKPIVKALRPWLEACRQDLSSANELARHIRHGQKHRDGLTRFLDDGRLEMGTNGVENAICPTPLTRRSALFAGSTDGPKTWARIASLIGTCKLNGVNPETCIAETLRKILDNHMQRDIPERMP